jgi:hypothetical protein
MNFCLTTRFVGLTLTLSCYRQPRKKKLLRDFECIADVKECDWRTELDHASRAAAQMRLIVFALAI